MTQLINGRFIENKIEIFTNTMRIECLDTCWGYHFGGFGEDLGSLHCFFSFIRKRVKLQR
jgi:hypothetical protein